MSRTGKEEEKKSELATIPTGVSLDLADFGDYAGAGLENIGHQDMVLPRLAILQSTSPAVADDLGRPGDLFNVTTNENYGKELDFIALAFWHSNTKWETPDINSPVECVSPDAITGSKYGACAACPHSKWTQDEKGNSVPPACTEFKNLLLLPQLGSGIVTASPFMIYSAKRSALRSMNRYLTAVKSLKIGDPPQSVPIFATVWKIKSKQETNQAKGAKYYTPEFTRVGFVTREMLPGLISRFEEFKEIREQMMAAAAQSNIKAAEQEGGEGESDDNIPY